MSIEHLLDRVGTVRRATAGANVGPRVVETWGDLATGVGYRKSQLSGNEMKDLFEAVRVTHKLWFRYGQDLTHADRLVEADGTLLHLVVANGDPGGQRHHAEALCYEVR